MDCDNTLNCRCAACDRKWANRYETLSDERKRTGYGGLDISSGGIEQRRRTSDAKRCRRIDSQIFVGHGPDIH